MWINGRFRAGYKPYRDITPNVDLEYRDVHAGFMIINQQPDELEPIDYVFDHKGDECGWIYWDANTRLFGSWAQGVPVIYSSGLVYPILNQSLSPDTSYQGKTLTNSPVYNDRTKIRNATGSTVENGQTGIAMQCLNQDSFEIIFISTGVTQAASARIAWNYSIDADLSEGEFVAYDEGSGEYPGTGEKIWIDWQLSRSVRFETAGTNTIFQISLVNGEETRGGETRALYRAITCIQDFGSEISHLRAINRSNFINYALPTHVPVPTGNLKFSVKNALEGELLSEDQVNSEVWDNYEGAKIFTLIGADYIQNMVVARIPRDWDVSAISSNFRWLEIVPGWGQPWLFRPIRPNLKDLDTDEYQSSSVSSTRYKRFTS